MQLLRKIFIYVILVLALCSLCTMSFAKTSDDEVTNSIINLSNSDGLTNFTQEALQGKYEINGISNWTGQCIIEDYYYVFNISANADVMPVHDSGDGYWVGSITQGSGTLLLGEDASEEISMIAGDYMIISPNTMYGWIPGDQDTIFTLVALSNLSAKALENNTQDIDDKLTVLTESEPTPKSVPFASNSLDFLIERTKLIKNLWSITSKESMQMRNDEHIFFVRWPDFVIF